MRARARLCLTTLLAAGALLLAGCGGGAEDRSLAEGTPTVREAVPGCPSGTDPDRAGPAGQDRPPAVEGILPATVDTDSAKVVALGPGRGETWTLDLCTNTWQRRAAATGPAAVAEMALVYDADSDVVVAWSTRERRAWAYDVHQDEWTSLAPPPDGALEDPVYEARSGRVVLRDGRSGALWSYDVDTDTWHPLAGPGASRDGGSEQHHVASFMVADPTRDQLVLVQTDPNTPGRTWRFDLSARRWTLLDATPPAMIFGYFELGSEAVLDASGDQVLLLGSGTMAAFDLEAQTWRRVALDEPELKTPSSGSDLTTGPLARLGHTLVHDPLNARVLVLGGQYRSEHDPDPSTYAVPWIEATEVWAYDSAGDSWVELVPPERSGER